MPQTCWAYKLCRRQSGNPTNQTSLRSFLGPRDFFRRFVPNFARIAAPFNKKFWKDLPKNFGPLNEDECVALALLKNAIVSLSVLTLSRQDVKYTLDAEACDKRIGCVPLQEQEKGFIQPVGYWSRTLTDVEQELAAVQRECIAVVWETALLRPYLDRPRLTIRTGHEAIRWISTLSKATRKLSRCRPQLSEF